MLREAGLESVRYRNVSFGIGCIHLAEAPGERSTGAAQSCRIVRGGWASQPHVSTTTDASRVHRRATIGCLQRVVRHERADRDATVILMQPVLR